ncbi:MULTISPECIES: response regulator [Paenibacillus]|uniref:response regulator n=1 Tax=Paenibacillus TaxID=44249 RepID=UPI00129D9B51|nr:MULTISPECIES: response regulator [Paenibacillus]MCM3207574.1 response regulator [Paenibacillus illinoisensis]WJH27733.1 response regulator [Paenibacillus sp. CC-CFT742]
MTTRNILCVDDNKMVLTILKRWLETEEVNVITVLNPKEAFEILENQEIDVVISDILMPDMDGLAFLRSLKRVYPHIVRIILSGHLHTSSMLTAINEVGIFAFMTKPLEYTDQFTTVILNALNQANRNRQKQISEKHSATLLQQFLITMLKHNEGLYLLLKDNGEIIAADPALSEAYSPGIILKDEAWEGFYLPNHHLHILPSNRDITEHEEYTLVRLNTFGTSFYFLRLY